MPILNVPVINKPLIIWYVEHDLVMHGYWAMKMRFYSLNLSFISIGFIHISFKLYRLYDASFLRRIERFKESANKITFGD